MVKINLLRERTVEQPVTRAPIEPKPIQAILVIAVLVIAAVALGTWYWWSKYNQLQEKRQQATELQQEADRLKNVQEEVEKYERINKILEERKKVIEQLKANQTGPIEMMNGLVQSMPTTDPKLWLESMSQTRDGEGETTHLVGYAYDVNAIADFYANLKKQNYFHMIDWLYYDKSKAPIKFEFDCRRNFEKPAEEEAQNG
jgi:Tfp pilus assembly protein PilN